jgi:hypothetical protein
MWTSNGGDDGDGNGDGGDRSGDGGEHDHNDVLICLLGQQNSVMSGQGRPGTMVDSDTAVEGGWHTARAAQCRWGEGNCSSGYMHMHNVQATLVVATLGHKSTKQPKLLK